MTLELLDARVKLIMLLTVSTLSVFSLSVIPLAVLLVILLAALVMGKADIKSAFMQIKGMLKLLALLFVLQCVFNRSGRAIISAGGITLLTSGGMSMAAVVVLRLLVILLSAVIVLTGQSRDHLLALNQWHVPYEISFMVMAAMRFVPILRQEASDVLCAVQMRGTRLSGLGPVNKMKVYAGIMLPVLSGTIRRCEQMSIAMEARAFRAMNGRTSMRRLHMCRKDWVYAAVFEALMCAVLVLVILCR